MSSIVSYSICNCLSYNNILYDFPSMLYYKMVVSNYFSGFNFTQNSRISQSTFSQTELLIIFYYYIEINFLYFYGKPYRLL